MSEKRCGDCKYFTSFRNYNYETCTNDTITEYCELLQNEDTYDRDKGDEIEDNIFDDCPLRKGVVSTESVIKLFNTREELQNQFDDYVHHSLVENEQLQKQLNKCCRSKLSDEAIKQAYADLNRREREKHSQGNATYAVKINQNEVIY